MIGPRGAALAIVFWLCSAHVSSAQMVGDPDYRGTSPLRRLRLSDRGIWRFWPGDHAGAYRRRLLAGPIRSGSGASASPVRAAAADPAVSTRRAGPRPSRPGRAEGRASAPRQAGEFSRKPTGFPCQVRSADRVARLAGCTAVSSSTRLGFAIKVMAADMGSGPTAASTAVSCTRACSSAIDSKTRGRFMRCFMMRLLPAALFVGVLQLGLTVKRGPGPGRARLFAHVPRQ